MRLVILSVRVCVRHSVCVSVVTLLDEDTYSYKRLLVIIVNSNYCYS